MVRKCCACFKGCGAGEKITLHKFPKDQCVRRQWLKAIERKNFVPSNTSVLCSRHFAPECFTYGKSGQQKRLFIKPFAVPTIFPPITQSRRSLMRSSLPPPNNTEDLDTTLSQSSGHGGYIKQEAETQDETNEASELGIGMSIGLTENTMDMEFLKEEGSSIDWVEHFDRSNDSEVHPKEDKCSINWAERVDHSNDSVAKFKRESNPESCDEEHKPYDNSDNIHEFKSRRRILRNLNLALKCIAAQRRELKIVKQKNRLLEKRLTILKALLTHVLSEKLLSDKGNDSDSDSESEIWSG